MHRKNTVHCLLDRTLCHAFTFLLIIFYVWCKSCNFSRFSNYAKKDVIVNIVSEIFLSCARFERKEATIMWFIIDIQIGREIFRFSTDIPLLTTPRHGIWKQPLNTTIRARWMCVLLMRLNEGATDFLGHLRFYSQCCRNWTLVELHFAVKTTISGSC